MIGLFYQLLLQLVVLALMKTLRQHALFYSKKLVQRKTRNMFLFVHRVFFCVEKVERCNFPYRTGWFKTCVAFTVSFSERLSVQLSIPCSHIFDHALYPHSHIFCPYSSRRQWVLNTVVLRRMLISSLYSSCWLVFLPIPVYVFQSCAFF